MSEKKQGGKQHNLRRSMKNRASGKYSRQELKTAKNKAKHRRRNAANGDPLTPIDYRKRQGDNGCFGREGL